MEAGETAKMGSDEERRVIAKIITAKLRVEELKLQKRVLVQQIYKYCRDAERPAKKQRRVVKEKVNKSKVESNDAKK